MNGQNDRDDQDVSWSVPWNENDSGGQELETIASIQEKNMREFYELRDAIKNSRIVNMPCPLRMGQSKETKELYLEEEKKCLEKFEKYNSEYNSLLELETKLNQKLNELDKTSKKNAVMKKEYIEKSETAKRTYHSHQAALSISRKVYENSFGMNINVEEGECDDLFVATVTFNGETKDVPIKFTINRALNQITDFDTGLLLPQNDLQELKRQFRESNDVLGLITTLRKFVLKKPKVP